LPIQLDADENPKTRKEIDFFLKESIAIITLEAGALDLRRPRAIISPRRDSVHLPALGFASRDPGAGKAKRVTSGG
jgi:hypothetical protein